MMEIETRNTGVDPFLPLVVEEILLNLISAVGRMDAENIISAVGNMGGENKNTGKRLSLFNPPQRPKADSNLKKDQLLKILTQKLVYLHSSVYRTKNLSSLLIYEPLKILFKKVLSISLEIDDFLDELALWSTQSKKKNKEMLLCIASFNSRLDQVCNDFTSFISSSTEATTVDEHSKELLCKSDPFIDPGSIVGRDDDARKVMEMILLESSEISPSVSSGDADSVLPAIAIFGMPGIGKTVLAQLIYNNETMVKHFSERFWVCANDGNFGVNMLVKEMFLSLTGWESKAKLDIETQKLKIREMLNGKRFLLVLDDVNDVCDDYWNHITLSNGGFSGSVILITTQREPDPWFWRASNSYHLHQLTEDHSWELFQKGTFSRIGTKVTPDLKDIRVLVKQIGGLPLGIKVMADQLLTRWPLDQSELLYLYEQTKEHVILPYLWLSFDRLPSKNRKFPTIRLTSTNVKLCFAFCATIPKGSRIYKDEVIQKWMAQGYLVHALDTPNVTMEDMGEDLLQGFFMQSVERDQYGKIVSFSMHDLVHDLAIYVSNRCDLNSDSSKTTNCYGVRHLSFFRNDVRNLSLFSREWEYPKPSAGSSSMSRGKELHSNALVDQIRFFTCLRSLSLVETDMEELPSSVGSLKHLRYLDISRCPIKRVPTSVTSLNNLETFRILDCVFLEQFPENFDKLVNLRHFYMDDDENHRDLLPTGLGQLSSLQTLPFFVVDPKRGRKIEELGQLSNLKGELKIYGLEHVQGFIDARKAKLDSKSRIHALEFHWSSDRVVINTNNEESVLHGLEPHGNLKGLVLENYEGLRLASWMTGRNASLPVRGLVELKLKNCRKIREVSILGDIPSLKVLSMKGMHGLEIISSSSNDGIYETMEGVILTLEKLTLNDMPKLYQWLSPCDYPRLQKLVIEGCPLLTSVPSSSFPAMNELVVEDIDDSVLRKISWWIKTLESLVIGMVSGSSDLFFCLENFLGGNGQLKQLRVQRCENLYKIPKELWNHPTLKSLEIWDCPNLHHIPRIQEPHSLLVFSICGCHNLSTLPMGLNNLKHLETFSISGCHQLYWVDSVEIRVLASLQKLIISDCGFLTSSDDWPQWLLSLTGLNDLTIGGFPRYLDYFPLRSSFDSLKNLTLEGWPNLKSLPTELQNFMALVKLRIFGFDGMEVLPEWLCHLPSLEYMQLWHCEILEYFPSKEAMKCLTKLLSLDIGGCPLLEERCIKGIGSEWDKISHIPSIRIGNDYIKGRRG